MFAASFRFGTMFQQLHRTGGWLHNSRGKAAEARRREGKSALLKVQD